MRTLVAVLGVAFAVLLIFMLLGFYGYAETAATSLYDALDFDLVLLSSNYLNITRARSFPMERLSQAREHREVASVTPLYLAWQSWRIKNKDGGIRRAILLLAFELDAPVFRPERVFRTEPVEVCLKRLHTPDTVLMDTETRRRSFGDIGIGYETELQRTKVRVVGRFTIGTGLGADGMVLTSVDTYSHLSSPRARERPALGLIRLRDKDRADAVMKELKQTLYSASPRDEVAIFTRKEIEKAERDYWMRRTSVGIIFLMGVFIALIVGVIFVYQVIATDIADHNAEYATLRAIGYRTRYLSGVVLRQALVLAALGYVPAYICAQGLYTLLKHEAELELEMTAERAVGVFLLSIAMCVVSGLLAMQKVKASDPAELF
jgi:putative ABC transport system permease protein